MTFCEFRKDRQMHVQLTNGYSLDSAPERDFGVHYAIYRNINPEFEDFLEYGSDLQGLNYCFWVRSGGQRIGGIIIRPNHVEGLFLRPPHTQAYEVLAAALPVLLAWSDKARPVEAADVMPHELELYRRLGFGTRSGRRVYIRPTERLNVHWESKYELGVPTPARATELAELFERAYSDYPPECPLGDLPHRAERDLNLTGLHAQATTLVYDRARALLVGACFVRLNPLVTRPDINIPRVSDIAVHPEYRRRGLASQMLKRALTKLSRDYATLRFGVAAGIPAEALYHGLGFVPGVTHYRLAMPEDVRAVQEGLADGKATTSETITTQWRDDNGPRS